MEENSLPFQICHIHKLYIFINRTHTIFHFIAIVLLLYYRASFFFQEKKSSINMASLIIFASEIFLSFLWLLHQAFKWRQVTRSAFPERLPEDNKLPAIDVFICTVDPDKEPTLGVMNTVLSAMAMDYPADKLHVYLSDDGGSYVTLNGLREAREFAKWWVPFCRRFKVKNRSPKAYFTGGEDVDFEFGSSDLELKEEKEKIKEKYEVFKDRVRELAKIGEKRTNNTGRDHPAFVEVIYEHTTDQVFQLPLVVYISREKRPSYHHHFKAGALNVLQRVSGVMSNSPYILVLDCDMYCNDPMVARRAMCFHLDPNISSSLAFVQFPQKFHNISNNDIYDSQLRNVFKVQWQGMDGQKGPCMSGSGFFIKRLSLCGNTPHQDVDPMKIRQFSGPSNEFIKSLVTNSSKPIKDQISVVDESLEEMLHLASCTYENGTNWGKEVGFLYGSVVEDYLTGFMLHCKGWTSVYYDPPRPQFLGCGITNLNDFLIQGTRWYSGLLDVGISKFCPLFYGSFRMSILQSLCYAELAFLPLNFISLWCFATIPQLCLLNGIPLYPEVSSSFFLVILFIFLSSLSKHFFEVLVTGGSFQTWMNEQRIWMMKSITSYLYGSADAIMKKIGMREASFLTTSKVEDDERVNLYQKGVFDFQTSTMFLAPMVSLVILNMASFLVGIARVVFVGDLEKMFIQISISFYILVMNYPIMEGMMIRKDKGRIPVSVGALSTILCMILSVIGSIVMSY